VDEVKTLILESVNVRKNCKKRVSSRHSHGVRGPRSDHTTRNVYSQLSRLEDVVFNDFIKDDFIPEGNGQVVSGSASLPDPVALETEDQTLEMLHEREQNENIEGTILFRFICHRQFVMMRSPRHDLERVSTPSRSSDCIRQYRSTYVSIHQYTSAHVIIRSTHET
jgi:hypothetical protein